MLKALALCSALCAVLLSDGAWAAEDVADVRAATAIVPHEAVQLPAAEGLPRALLGEKEKKSADPADARNYKYYRVTSAYYFNAQWAIKRISSYPDILIKILGPSYDSSCTAYYAKLVKIYIYREYNYANHCYDQYWRLIIRIKYGYDWYWKYYDVEVYLYVPYPYSSPGYIFKVGRGNYWCEGHW